MKKKVWVLIITVCCVGLVAFNQDNYGLRLTPDLTDTNCIPKHFGFGRTANPQEIAAWDIDVRPDGKGLPAGEGNATLGKVIYTQKCVACHG